MDHFEMKLTQKQAPKYQRSTKKEKGEILTRYCELTGVSRNTASKRFWKVIRNRYPRVLGVKHSKKRGRRATYTSIHKAVIKKAWELGGEVCGERLYPMMGEYIDALEKKEELKFYGKRYIQEARKVSEGTLKRVVAEFPKPKDKRHQGNSDLYKQIPIEAYFGDHANEPGYQEVDYVENNGGNSSGQFVITGAYVDVCLGWLARGAALGKSQKSVTKIHNEVLARIRHPIYEFHPDNAKPILKELLERQRAEDFKLSRSRPYHKEDNGHVEQKNGDKVRKLIGYHRYDTPKQVELLNQLYRVEDEISNHFVASQKLVEKVVDERGRVISRRHDRAKTSYQRLMESGIDDEVKMKVKKIRAGLDLVELRKQSEKLQKELFSTVVSRN